MEDSVLFQTIGALTDSERRELRIFLKNRLAGSVKNGKQILALFILIDNHLRSRKSEENLQKEAVFSTLFEGKQYKPGNFENLMSGLLTAVRQFIFELTLRKRWGDVLEELSMAEFYRCRSLPLRAKQALNRAESALLRVPTVSNEYSWLRWQRAHEAFLQAAAENQRKGLLYLPETLRSFISHFAPELLKLSAAYVNQQRVVGDKQDEWSTFLNGFRDLCVEAGYFEHTGLYFLDQAMQLMDMRQELTRTQLDEFNRKFLEHQSELSEQYAKVIAAYIRNAMIRILHQYSPEERLHFYHIQLDAGWLYEQDRLQASSYLNIVKVAMQAGNEDWLRTFLSAHREKIDGPQKENVRLIGEAQYYFSTGAWKMVDSCLIELRQLPKLRDISQEKLMRILEIKTAFELGQEEHLLNLLTSFQIFLKRNKSAIGQLNYSADYNFIRVVRALSRLKAIQHPISNSNLKKADKNLISLGQAPGFPLAEQAWLYEKCLEK